MTKTRNLKRREVVYQVLDNDYPYPAMLYVPRKWSGFTEQRYCAFVGIHDTKEQAETAVRNIPESAIN